MIRQEDSISILQQDTQVVVFLKNRAGQGQAGFRGLEHSAGARFGGQALAQAERAVCQSGVPAAEGRSAGLDVGCHAEASQATEDRSSIERGCGEERPGGERRVPTLAMGSGEKGVHISEPASSLLQGGDRRAHQLEDAGGTPTCDISLPRHAEAHGGDDLRNRPVHARDSKQISGVTAGLLPVRQDEQELVRPPRLGHLATARQIAAGEHGRSIAARLVSLLPPQGRHQLKSPQLRNTSNYCYANASVLALMWTITYIQEAQRMIVVDSPFIRFIGWLSTQTRPVLLCSTIAWQSITQSWPHPGRQHDTSEFLQFLTPEVFQADEVGKWESRVQIAGNLVQADDCGTTWPLPLSAALHPEADNSIQSLIDIGGAQANLHALSRLPGMLALQIARFTDQGIKCSGRIVPSWSFAVPYFPNEGIDVEHSLYQVTAIVYHVGPFLQGHYRAVLFEEGVPSHHTDDGKKAVKFRPRDLSLVLSNAYLIFANKSS